MKPSTGPAAISGQSDRATGARTKARESWRMPWLKWAQSSAMAAAAIIGAGLVAFVSTWFLLSPAVESIDRNFLTAMIFANVAIAATFALLIGARIWDVWSDRRNQHAGSHTQMKLLGQFAVVAILPALIAFLFAFTILRTSLNDVFSERIERYQATASTLADRYYQERGEPVYAPLLGIRDLIAFQQQNGKGIEDAPIYFRQIFANQAALHGFDALLLLNDQNQVLVSAVVNGGGFKIPDTDKFNEWRSVDGQEAVFLDPVDSTTFDLAVAGVKLNFLDGLVMLGYKQLDQETASLLLTAYNNGRDWEKVKEGRSRYERVFLAGYIVLAFIIIFGAMWLALGAATRIVQPIGRLVNMSERVSSGDLSARVEVQKDDGELGALARSMNHMTAQLQTQRNDLIETNRQFDNRRRFTEAVLSGVSAGVVSASRDGRLMIANRSAAEFLGEGEGRLLGRSLPEVLPEIAPLFEAAVAIGRGEIADQIEVERDGRIRNLNVRIVSDEVDGEASFIITFDDITELIGAQRSAAWGDVARRIAHEIKNPLTPIQLSAERLRRKYMGEITQSPDVFDKCTDTIIRHVGDIRRMVDEFSSFARMPTPVIKDEDIRELVKVSVFSQRVAFPDIEFQTSLPDAPVQVECDDRLIAQALGNLIKNAGESISARIVSQPTPPGRVNIDLVVEDDYARIHVVDNGVGLPTSHRHRLTEPYMTTREKGTGLGLAIVRKVLEDHDGSIAFNDCDRFGPTGACVSLSIPLASAKANEPAASADQQAAE